MQLYLRTHLEWITMPVVLAGTTFHKSTDCYALTRSRNPLPCNESNPGYRPSRRKGQPVQ